MADVGHAPQEAQMSTGDERLDAVEDRIDEAAEPAVLSRARARRRRRG